MPYANKSNTHDNARIIATIKDRILLHDVIAPHVQWDARRSTPRKGDYWAPCPFHGEKTASFHVQNDKQSYYCFGCHAKGDAFTFLTEYERLSFGEAVQKLASMAGVVLPQYASKQRQAAAHQNLRHALQVAHNLYTHTLHSAAGQAALGYLRQRGMTDAEITTFGLGYSPADRHFLRRALHKENLTDADGINAGVLVAPDESNRPAYDRFRERIIFPIYDAAGKLISFAGRTLNPQVSAKYLNGSETALFHKGEVLFNLHVARKAASKSGKLIVCEGYVDVMAFYRAGLAEAVAPMGTALTQEQLQLLWRHAAEPLIVFDGDSAGQRAADRALELALPLLQAGRSLQFVFLPEGQDPDDVVRHHGSDCLHQLLGAAIPLSQLLFKKYMLDVPTDTPERLVGARNQLKQAVERIADVQVRDFYHQDMRKRLSAWRGAHTAYQPASPSVSVMPSFARKKNAPPLPLPPQQGSRNREYLLLGMLLTHEALLPLVVEELAALPMHDAMAMQVQKILLSLDCAQKCSNLAEIVAQSLPHGASAIAVLQARTPAYSSQMPIDNILARWRQEAAFHTTRSTIKRDLHYAARLTSIDSDSAQQMLEQVRFLHTTSVSVDC